jgi:AP-3 complex subunit delta-1
VYRRPGGIALKPLLYYDIKGAKKQVNNGDVMVSCPQWNEVGAVDYVGKAEWGSYNKWKGKTTDQAKAVFCKLFKSAMADPKSNFF